jgi:GNAT superfamily N-acetyltransferase
MDSMKLSKEEMYSAARSQLAIDLNCSEDDFAKDRFVFCEAKANPGRRPFPRSGRCFEMLTMGGAVIVSATPDILPFLKEQLNDVSRDEAFSMPFVHGQGSFYLPDNPAPLELPRGFVYELIEQNEIPALYSTEGFRHAIQYDLNHPRPDVLVTTAKKDGKIIGMAGASVDCAMLWQIGIDVLSEYRNLGIAAALTSRLAIEILERGKIPYYGTASSNIASQRTAHRAGLMPAWSCTWRGRFDNVLTEPTS